MAPHWKPLAPERETICSLFDQFIEMSGSIQCTVINLYRGSNNFWWKWPIFDTIRIEVSTQCTQFFMFTQTIYLCRYLFNARPEIYVRRFYKRMKKMFTKCQSLLPKLTVQTRFPWIIKNKLQSCLQMCKKKSIIGFKIHLIKNNLYKIPEKRFLSIINRIPGIIFILIGIALHCIALRIYWISYLLRNGCNKYNSQIHSCTIGYHLFILAFDSE